MTSYANDTTTNTTSGTTTKTTPAHNETTSSAATTTTTTTTTMQQPSANTAFNNNKKMSTVTTLAKPPSQLDFDCCDGSSSDGREKSDATPENIKKIDEIINEETSSSSSLLLSPVSAAIASTTGVGVGMTTLSPSSTSSTPPLSPASAARFALNSSFVGLGAAIDDSNAKFCLAKKPFCTEKDTLAKSKSNNNIIESNEPIATKPSPTTTTATTTARNSVSATSNNESIYSSSYNNDNRHAVNSDVQNNVDDDDSSTATTTTTSATTKQSLAFTIDTFNDKENDPTVQAARYKSMMERFQTRHRRGASMSKLESEQLLDGGTSAATTPTTNVRSSGRHMQRSQETELSTTSAAATPTEQPKVRLRVRDRSTSRVRDASKRHSWSPRSSSSTMAAEPTQTNPAQARKSGTKPSRLPPPAATKGAANLIANRTQFTPRSTAMQLALQKVDFVCPEPPLADFKQLGMDADAVSDTGTYTLDGDNYTEEQKDYMNIDRSGGGGGEAQSKQKVRPKDLAVKRGGGAVDNSVNISRGSNVLEVNYYHETPVQEKPTQKQKAQLKINTTTSDASDLLLGGHQSAGEFLEQIKSRVLRNMAGGVNTSVGSAVSDCKATADMEKSDDVGCFTSVTTSGVLAKQRALDMHPKMTRCTSLSTSQIDSSEYVSNEVKLKHANPLAAAGGFTDHQKAEYRLNVFSTSGNKDAKFAATRKLIATPPETPTNKTQQELSDTAMLKTAHSKQDWIQEWARNARARSLASDNVKQRKAATQELMTRSYTCAETSAADSLTDDSIYSQQHHQQQQQQYSAKLNKSLAERYRLLPAGDCDFSSDPALNAHNDLAFKPPKSPSKIPSPMHSLGRARSASRTRASLQHILPDMDAGTAEDYLQKTAAAISNLQQSLSRKNSIKSPTHSASPRTRPHPAAHIYTPDEYSPQHSMESGSAVSYRHSPMHRRNLSHETNYSSGGRSAREALMTSSMNEAQLQLLTSGEYLLKQMRRRKNSLDAAAAAAAANMEPVSPIKQQYGNTQRTNINDDASLSPLRRSSSFSTAKLMAQHQQQQQQQRKPTTRQARPQFQNIYTPPAARHQYTFAAASNAANAALLKKSASSNNFGQVYSDYDDNLQYYINDEDELGTGGEYYSSGEEDEQRQLSDEYYHQHQQQQQQQQLASAEAQAGDAMPVSNTRLNKVLLMRIERSKQRVAGNANVSGSGGGNVSKPNSAPAGKLHAGVVGVVACPNTPELPRRGIKSAPRASAGGAPTKARQSMPRDTSLSRLATHVPNSLDSAKKQLLQTAYGVPNANTNKLNQRVQPKYMDISKYKPAQSNNFLRKNDSKSTLKSGPPDHMKRSPSASSMGLSRADPTRTSNRSVRSVQSVMNSSTTSLGSTRGSSAVRRDVSVNKQKEAEMAMWKRRSTYDPMKAAAEDRRKKEEAKRVAQANKQLANENELPFERPSRSHYRRGQF